MSPFTGTRGCLRLAWRRNRLFWLLWVLALSTLMPMTAQQYTTIVPPGADPRTTLEPLASNPSMTALLGPAFDLSTKGGFVFWRVGGFASCFAGMMAAFAVVRATRAEEEDGRLELVRAGAVGRHAPLAGAMLLGVLGSLGLGVATAAFAAASGLPPAGSAASGLACTSTGLVFTGIGAVCAQVFATARAARAWAAGAFFGGMFLARMLVDGSAAPGVTRLRWLIPMEWGMLLRPYAGERWWVLVLPVALTALLCAVAVVLEARRDHGAGLVQPRLGRAHAPASLSGAWGLAWRLQRGGLLGWTLALVVSALGTGSIMTQLDRSLATDPQLGERIERLGGTTNVTVAFYVSMLGILATVAAIMAATVLSRLRSEEVRGHAEPVLATATPRTTYALSHLVWALVAPCVALVLVGAALPVTQARAHGDWGLVGTYTRAALVLLPGVLLVAAVAMLLVGWLPRLTGLVWVVVGWSLFATMFAPLLGLPRWVAEASPWGHLPVLPRDPMAWTPVLVELALAAVLVGLGLVGYRRRSIPA